MKDPEFYPFRCRYLDVKHSGRSAVESYLAENEAQAVTDFILHRRKEQWSLPDIFVYSKPVLRNEVTGKEYTMNEYGELSPAGLRMF